MNVPTASPARDVSPAPSERRPRVAALCSVYFAGSHADVILGRILDGYTVNGRHRQSRIELASVYLEQLGSGDNDPVSRIDVGVGTLRAHSVPLFDSVGEALALGGCGVQVDGVLVIAEHGDYGWGEFEQKLYPRRRFFDASVAAMVAAGRRVPVFVDKHLAWSFTDAASMVRDAERLGIPLLAGSSVPLTWRRPQGADWPLGHTVSDALVISLAASEPGCRPTEMSGFHNLEFAQSLLERRHGGESGIASVTAVTGARIPPVLDSAAVDPDQIRAVLTSLSIRTDDPAAFVRSCADDLFLIEYQDGTALTVINLDLPGPHRIAAALRGPSDTVVCEAWFADPTHGNFTFLLRQIENLMLTGKPAYPVTRTLLTGGATEAALRSRHENRTVATPHLLLSYQPPHAIPDSGFDEVAPVPRR